MAGYTSNADVMVMVMMGYMEKWWGWKTFQICESFN